MNQFAQYPLMSPQQMQQRAQQMAPPASSWPAQAPQTSPANAQRFSQVSQLLSPDQLNMPTASTASHSLLANPVSLFGKQVTPSAPARPIPIPNVQVSLPGARPIPRPNAQVTLPALQTIPRPNAQATLPALNLRDLRYRSSLQKLASMSPAELKSLGQSDQKAFFAALLPAAIESEKEFGVPAELTLAQAALESGWARSPIGGYNIFGIKGSGPAGKVSVNTTEYLHGQYVHLKDGFAKYHNFYEAIKEHGELFHNGYYDKAINQYGRDRNLYAFIDNIQGIYATDPHYSQKIKSLIQDYGLEQMVNETGMV